VIKTNRRTFLKGTAATGVITLAATAGLLRPATVWAANWPKNAMEAKSIDAALQALYGDGKTSPGKGIQVTANQQAENGAMVPVQVETSMNADAVSIFVKENTQPLAVAIKVTGAAAFLRANIKMAKTSEVVFVVRSGGKLYHAKQNIKVTAGGCGG